MRRVLPLLVLAAVFTATRAEAFHLPNVIVTNTQVLSTSPLQVRFTFAMQNPADGLAIDNMKFSPTDGSHILSCGAPPNWTCNGDFWNPTAQAGLLAPGTTQQPFQIVIDSMTPCYLWSTETVILEIDSANVCLPAGGALPAQTLTWGKMKSIYR